MKTLVDWRKFGVAGLAVLLALTSVVLIDRSSAFAQEDATGTIEGNVWFDRNGDTIQQSGGAGDVNDDGATNIVDALIVARCAAGIVLPSCPTVAGLEAE